MGRMWIFYEHSQGPDCWYSIGGRLLGRFSSISSGGQKKKKAQQQNILASRAVFLSSTKTMTKMMKMFSIIVDKTKTKIKTRDEGKIEINGIYRISEAKFGR